MSSKTCTFYSILRDKHRHVSAWLPNDHQNPVPTVLPPTPGWKGNKSKAVLPGSAWRDTHSSASQRLTAACPGQTPRCQEGKIPFRRGGMQGLGGGDPSMRAGHQLRRWKVSLTAGKAKRELLHSSHAVAHLSLPSAHAACTGAVRRVNPLLAAGQEAGALSRHLPFPVLSNPSPRSLEKPLFRIRWNFAT